MKQIINVISGNNRARIKSQEMEQVCNYQDNYYGDQVCMQRPVEQAGQPDAK